MTNKIKFNGYILNGSVSTARSQCGKQNCACKAKKPKLHGIYYRWTGIIDGKRTTKTITPQMAKECRSRIKNYKKLKEQLDLLLEQALKEAPWITDFKK